jgi:hypothetical protein
LWIPLEEGIGGVKERVTSQIILLYSHATSLGLDWITNEKYLMDEKLKN